MLHPSHRVWDHHRTDAGTSCTHIHLFPQKSNGNGFGYRIVNDTSVDRPLAHTILATGGSGKERNLIYDPINGRDIAGTDVPGKKTPINEKCIRTMTPEEWGRLQGFIGYAFLDKNGNETFSFPEKMSNQHFSTVFGFSSFSSFRISFCTLSSAPGIL